MQQNLFIMLMIIMLITSQYVPEDVVYAQDIVLEQGQVTLDHEHPLIVNITSPGSVGYYGSWVADSGVVNFTLIDTGLLEGYLQGWNNAFKLHLENRSIPRWEYPSHDVENVSIIFQTDSPVTLYYEIFEDTTAPEIVITVTRTSVFPPIYEVVVELSGGFESHAWVLFPNKTQESYAQANDTLNWYAYNVMDGIVVPIPDGEYNITVRGFDTLHRESIRVFPIVKGSSSTGLLIFLSLLGVMAFAFATEYTRRKIIRPQIDST